MVGETSRSDVQARVTMARVVVTIVAASLVLQALSAIVDPDPAAPHPWWSLAPVGLASVALALVWRRRPDGVAAALVLFAAAAITAFTVFGDSPFARMAAGAIALLLFAFAAWTCIVLPLLAWRRGRWPVDRVAFVPFAGGPPIPQAVRDRVDALVALEFSPRLVHARAEGRFSGTIVVLAHPRRDALGIVTHIAAGGDEFVSTRLTTGRLDEVSLVDAVAPAPFPAAPGVRVLYLPDASASVLFAHFVRVHPGAVKAMPSDDAIAATLDGNAATDERWLVEAGYLAPGVQDETRRYTLKGGFTAVLRPSWPWYPLRRARLAREGREELGGSSRAA